MPPPPRKRCCCHVTGQDFSRPSALLFFQIVGRLLLAVHFAWELVSSLINWDALAQQLSDNSIPIPSVILGALLALLIVGTPLLLGGIFMRWMVAVLVTYQIAAPALLDSTIWPFAMSVVGGLFTAVAVDELQRAAPANGGGRCGSGGSRRRPAGARRDAHPDDAVQPGDEPLLDPLSDEAYREDAGSLRYSSTGNAAGGSTGDLGAGRSRVLSDRAGEIIV